MLSRRALVSAAAAAPVAALLPQAPIAASQADPIFAAIEAHRRAHSKFVLATAVADIKPKYRESPRVIVGYFNDFDYERSETDEYGGFTATWKPNGKRLPRYAGRSEIERNAPRELQGEERNAWIAERLAALEKEERRLAKAFARTKLGKLEAARDKAYDLERDRMWDLISTRPTTIAGLCALLEYCRIKEGISELVHDDEWEDALAWIIESTVRALAGLAEPPMPDIVASLIEDAGEEEAAA